MRTCLQFHILEKSLGPSGFSVCGWTCHGPQNIMLHLSIFQLSTIISNCSFFTFTTKCSISLFLSFELRSPHSWFTRAPFLLVSWCPGLWLLCPLHSKCFFFSFFLFFKCNSHLAFPAALRANTVYYLPCGLNKKHNIPVCRLNKKHNIPV